MLFRSNVIGFDSGPGNVLMDAWTRAHRDEAFDRDGTWAMSGSVHSPLLKRMLAEPYLKLPAPKSTGRELFNRNWLQHYLDQLLEEVAAVDVQATLLEYTAQTIRLGIEMAGIDPTEIYLCGGGAHNAALLNRLAALHHPNTVQTTQALGIAPEWVEAVAFAWLARQALQGHSVAVSPVTGASADAILGAVYAA